MRKDERAWINVQGPYLSPALTSEWIHSCIAPSSRVSSPCSSASSARALRPIIAGARIGDFFTVETILVATPLRPLLHRIGQPPYACRRLHAESERAVGRPAGSAAVTDLGGRSAPMRFLIRDRDQKFTDRFDDVFRSEGIEIVRTPCRAPQANVVAERFVRTARSKMFRPAPDSEPAAP